MLIYADFGNNLPVEPLHVFPLYGFRGAGLLSSQSSKGDLGFISNCFRVPMELGLDCLIQP